LIELLVVVAIIALLIAILLPSLNQAREQAKAVKCLANTHHVGQAVHAYLGENVGAFPPSYIYPKNANGGYDLYDQPGSHPYGYLHWSWFLYNQGQAGDEAFGCPSMDHGGTPRTNPGDKDADWNAGQADQNGQTRPNSLTDRQIARVAFTANAAVIPRNKFTNNLSGGPRVNRIVKETEMKSAGSTIILAELNRNWATAAVQEGGGLLSKTHRPVNPFYHVGSGTNEYQAAPSTPGFMYGPPEDQRRYGLKPLNIVNEKVGVIDGSVGPEINVVARHHPGGDELGGTGNFLYADGHGEKKTILETMKRREWGEKYFSITGRNEVINRYGQVDDD
jgi:prepilin-type processing-associated H-X9-DG protein